VALGCVYLLVGSASAQQTEIIRLDAEYRYLTLEGAEEDPELADPNFDSTWFTPGYDDSWWEGPSTGPFDYGGVGDLESEPTVTFLLEPFEGDKWANYFRHEFTTTETYSSVGLNVIADDGAVFYLNGEEVLRFNCCNLDGQDIDDYFAYSTAGGSEDFPRRPTIVLDELPPGNHLLAVSLHQSGQGSSDMGLGVIMLSDVEPPPPPDPNAILKGIDTYITESAKSGADGSYGELEEFEWDNSDGGGANAGLLWFDIPQDRLDNFGEDGTATLRLVGTGNGDSGDMYRMTVDWLSDTDGGDNVSWNSLPNGPGIVPGQNAEATANVQTGFIDSGSLIEIDVTEDVRAWANGAPNYGWGIVPTGGNGAEVASFESIDKPQLIVDPGQEIAGPALQAGDADQDLDFDQLDLVQVQIAAKYLSGQPATWGEGDWDAAPGGSPGSPPTGDGFFNQFDIIAAQVAAQYLAGPYAAVGSGGQAGDGQTSVVYDPATGEMSIDAPSGMELTSVNIDSAAGIFTGDAAANLGGSFDNDADNNIFKATFGGSFGSLSFGNVAQAGLSEEFLLGDLTVVGSLSGGGALGDVDLIYVPEPASLILIGLGLIATLMSRVRGRASSNG
jgi:hypothetical protein